MNGKRLDALQDPSDGLYMPLVLPNRIPELVFVTVDVLSPVLAVFPTVNPPLIVLGLDDEDTIYGKHDMVNLCAVSAGLKKKIVNDPIVFLRQAGQAGSHMLLSALTLRATPYQCEDEDCNYDDYGEHGGDGKEGYFCSRGLFPRIMILA